MIRLECFLRLLLSVALFCKFWVMRNFKFEFEQKFVVYIVLIAFALYPYAMELVLQTPLSLLCRGSFFVLHHVDPLTSLPNRLRLHKDVGAKLRWAKAMAVANVRHFAALNAQYGARCGDATLTRVMQRIVFEMEDESAVRMRLYRLRDDRFLVVAAFASQDDFARFVATLAGISLTVLRPSDFADNDAEQRRRDKGKGKDVVDAVSPGAASGATPGDDDFINPKCVLFDLILKLISFGVCVQLRRRRLW